MRSAFSFKSLKFFRGTILKPFILLFFCLALSAAAENLTQTVRGAVYDATTQQPLPGANIIILDSNPMLGASSDVLGEFRIDKVPVGRITVQAMFIGYKPAFANNLLVHSGKEASVRLELEQDVIEMEEISVTAAPKYEAINQMAVASARMFTIEETDKYAGSRGDVARMASNFAGVSFANDSRNDIIIRGNSPAGLLWRLEGVDIPNPNHFAMEGTTGGPVGMLNNNTLNNSDFITGAFPSEYGNAMSGVFDLQLRKGNSDEYEFLGQTGFNGFELGAEGPLHLSDGSSFLANYRYSTLDVMDKIGMDFGAGGIPRYQDFSGKVVVPIKNGRIDGFVLWGDSEIAILDSNDPEQDFYSKQGQDLYNGSTAAASGFAYTRFHNKNASSKLTLSGTYQKGGTDIYRLEEDERLHELDDNYIDYKASVDYLFAKRFNSKISSESGFSIDRLGFDLDGRVYDFDDNEFMHYFQNSRSLADGPTFSQLYSSWRYRPSNELTLKTGVNASYFDLNMETAIDPRLGVSYDLSNRQTLSLAYGMHSKIQSLVAHYFINASPNQNAQETNFDLGFTKAQHIVAGYDFIMRTDLRLKIEAYYQYLYNVPVRSESSSYSILNTGADFAIDLDENMVNDGTGKNYGLEFTLEKFYTRGLYYLATLSLFDSKYAGSDGIERNTRFNTSFVANALVGKEFRLDDRKVIFFDVKTAWSGGQRYTPIDLERSQRVGSLKYDESLAFSVQHPNYFKIDAKIGFRLSGVRTTQEWMFYVENLTSHKNVLRQKFDAVTGQAEPVYQLGIFPMMQYRIYF
jgi:hypothetical protein